MKLFSYGLLSIAKKYSTKFAPKCPLNKPQNTNSTNFDPNYSLIKPQNTNFTKFVPKYPTNEPEITNGRKPIRSKVIKVQWTDQQLQDFDESERHESVFITGTGKTKLIQELIKLLRKKHGGEGFYVTAPTVIVACALGGHTLHSFGVGLTEADAQTLLSRVLSHKRVLGRWEIVNALVIDEISMVRGELFDKLECIGRYIKRKDEPWGGIQLVACGGFLQLPPVNVGKSFDNRKEFAFEAYSWDQSFQLEVCLDTIFRQSDPEHIRLLEGMRRGELDNEGLKLLEKHRCSQEPNDTVVRLYPRTRDVSRVNDMRLKVFGEEIMVYEAFDKGEKPMPNSF